MKNKIEFSHCISEIPKQELDRIFDLVNQGYVEGEIIISDSNPDENGHWKLSAL
jgi:hypothetical protein